MRASLLATFVCILLVCITLPPTIAVDSEKVWASDSKSEQAPDRYGIATSFGYGYDTRDDLKFLLVTGVALFDYEKVWHHAAPESLRFKVEFSAGTSTAPRSRFMASGGILALYYLDRLSAGSFRPYIEGGIGGIYTDFQEKGQGSRFNFNPQAGIGADFTIGSDISFFTAIRSHHVSNAGLADQNRGINSVLFMLGHYF